MHTRRLLSALAITGLTATLLATVGPSAGALPASGSAGAAATGAPDTGRAEALRFREGFFLDTSSTTIEALQEREQLANTGKAAATMIDVDTTYGVPLTRAEKAEIDRRQGLLDKHAAKLDAQLIKLGDKVPDVVLDHRRAKIVVRTKLPTAKVAGGIRSLGVASSDIVVESPRWTLEQLLGFQREVQAARKAGDPGLATVNGVGVEHDTQQLFVQASDSLDAVEASVGRLLPSGSFLVGEGTSRSDSQNAESPQYGRDPSPYHAGWKVDFTPGSWCTLGVPAYGPGPKFYLLTSGHCGPLNSQMCQPDCATSGPNRGTVVKNTISGPDDREPVVDALAIGSAAQYTHARIYGGAKMVTRETWNADHVGQVDCRLGVKTGYHCGKLLEKSYDPSFPVWGVERQFHHVRRTDYFSEGGDSGGPHYRFAGSTERGVIHGIHSGSNTRDGRVYGFYAHIDDVLAYLGLTNVYLAND